MGLPAVVKGREGRHLPPMAAGEHQLLREIAYWRHILTEVAKDMDATAEKSPEQRRWCESRAKRIRQRLEFGVPPRWTQPPRMG